MQNIKCVSNWLIDLHNKKNSIDAIQIQIRTQILNCFSIRRTLSANDCKACAFNHRFYGVYCSCKVHDHRRTADTMVFCFPNPKENRKEMSVNTIVARNHTTAFIIIGWSHNNIANPNQFQLPKKTDPEKTGRKVAFWRDKSQAFFNTIFGTEFYFNSFCYNSHNESNLMVLSTKSFSMNSVQFRFSCFCHSVL